VEKGRWRHPTKRQVLLVLGCAQDCYSALMHINFYPVENLKEALKKQSLRMCGTLQLGISEMWK